MPSTDGGCGPYDKDLERGRKDRKVLIALCEFLESGTPNVMPRMPEATQLWWLTYKREKKKLEAYHLKVRIERALQMQEEAKRLQRDAEKLMERDSDEPDRG